MSEQPTRQFVTLESQTSADGSALEFSLLDHGSGTRTALSPEGAVQITRRLDEVIGGHGHEAAVRQSIADLLEARLAEQRQALADLGVTPQIEPQEQPAPTKATRRRSPRATAAAAAADAQPAPVASTGTPAAEQPAPAEEPSPEPAAEELSREEVWYATVGDLAAFRTEHDRWPAAGSKDETERELGKFLANHRARNLTSIMDPEHHAFLDQAVPGWTGTSAADDAAAAPETQQDDQPQAPEQATSPVEEPSTEMAAAQDEPPLAEEPDFDTEPDRDEPEVREPVTAMRPPVDDDAF